MGTFGKLAFAVAARRRTIPGAQLGRLVQTAVVVPAATAVQEAVLGVLPPVTLAIAARSETLLGTRAAAGPVLVDATHPVAAPAAVHRAILGGLHVDTLAVAARPQADGFVTAGQTLALEAILLQRAGVVVAAGLTIVARGMAAFPRVTHINGAGVEVVVTFHIVVHVSASALRIATIIGADLAVVAVHEQTDADSLLAVVIVGTGIGIEAGHPGQGLVGASLLSPALVVGAFVGVPAQLALIHRPVAVIVRSVAYLDLGNGCVALPRTVRRGCPPAPAGAELVGHRALGAPVVGLLVQRRVRVDLASLVL